ncbi:MAG: GGDEF domain-containing protein [Acholeplasmatales bacterium]|nr:GGDEF domain-containing protein [Acholeplasmatales bacterium]
MILSEAIEIIKKDLVNRDNYYNLIEAFLEDNSENNAAYFNKLVTHYEMPSSPQLYSLIIKVLDRYEALPFDSALYRYYVYYSKAYIFFNMGDFYHTIDYSFKILELENLDYKYRYYGDVFLVNVLFALKDDEHVLETNTQILADPRFKELSVDYQIVSYFNQCLAYINLNNYDKSLYYFNITKDLLEKNANKRYLNIQEINRYYAISKFGHKFSKDYVEKSLNNYIKFVYEIDADILSQNFDIHLLILEALLDLGKKEEVKAICTYFLQESSCSNYTVDLLRILLKCIDKSNVDEYINILEKYNKALESEFEKKFEREKLYYSQVSRYYQMNTKYTELETSYNHDALTGLLSRGSYESICDMKDFSALAYIDINNLKTINDTYGHRHGDLYLKEFAKNLNVSLDADIYRVGGDEFIAVFKNKSRKEVINSINRLNDLPLFETKDDDKFSCGIYFNTDNIDIKQAAIFADEALYLAKKDKNILVIYND